MTNDDLAVSKRIYAQFINPNSKLFLETNSEKLFQAAKEDANLFPVTRDEIQFFKNNLETASRNFQSRVLRDRPRYLRFKSYITFAPRTILAADLLFVKSLKHLGKKTIVISLFLDLFSRMVYLSTQNSTTSQETLTHFEEALAFFGCSKLDKYKYFASDRGLVRFYLLLFNLLIFIFDHFNP